MAQPQGYYGQGQGYEDKGCQNPALFPGAPSGGQPPPPGPYGAPPPGQYGAPPPGQYGAPPPGQYGGPPPGQYGAPPQGQYGAQPPGQYGGRPPGPYGAPQGQYGAAPMPPPGAPAGQVNWMQRPETIPGCPPGLEYLTQVDQLLVHQQMELLEMFTNWETKNKYQVKNSMGQQVYFAAEESDMCMRQCCGPQRGFTMHITDNMGQEVIRINRPFKCCAGGNCCAFSSCCSMEIEIEAPVGQVIGYVRQTVSCLAPKYLIQDAQENTILQVEGPMCICQGPCCTWDQEFVVFSGDKSQEVGKISKQWSGLVREYFSDADNFGVSFPADLDVKMKAVMLGAVFLIDFMFFEQKQNNQHN